MNVRLILPVLVVVCAWPVRAEWVVGFFDVENTSIFHPEPEWHVNPIITNQPDPLPFYAGSQEALFYTYNSGFQPSGGELLAYNDTTFPDRPARSPWTITASAPADNRLVVNVGGVNTNQLFEGMRNGEGEVDYTERALIYNLAFSALLRPDLPEDKLGRGGDLLAITGARITVTYDYASPVMNEDMFQTQLSEGPNVFFAYMDGSEGSEASSGELFAESFGTQEEPIFVFGMEQGGGTLGAESVAAFNLALTNGFNGEFPGGNAVSFQIEYEFDFTWLNALDEFIWEGAEGFDFSNPANWSRNMAPGFYDTVQFAEAGLKTIEFAAADYVRNEGLVAIDGSQTEIDLKGSLWEIGGHATEADPLGQVMISGASVTLKNGTVQVLTGDVAMRTDAGNSHLAVENGGRLIVPTGQISVGVGGGSHEATLSVDGANSYVEANTLLVGNTGRGTALIVNEALVYAASNLIVGGGAVGELTVTGEGSRLRVGDEGFAGIGNNAKGTLTIENGASADFGENSTVRVGLDGVEGYLSVRGEGSRATQGKYAVMLGGLVSVSEGAELNGQELKIEGGAVFFQSGATGTLKKVEVHSDLATSGQQGVLTVEGGASLTTDTLLMASAQMVVADGGRVEVKGTPGATEFTGANSAAVFGGLLEVREGAVFKTPFLLLYLGKLAGRGTIEGDVRMEGGETGPGQSPGALTIDGDFTQTGGRLVLEIGGATPGELYDQLVVTGDLRIEGGVIEFAFVNGFAPEEGQEFAFFDVLGDFDFTSSSVEFAVSGLEAGWEYETSFGAGGVTMTSLNAGVAASVVPEPATAAAWLGAWALAGATAFRRRRRV